MRNITMQEMALLLCTLREYYPNMRFSTTPENQVRAWHAMLSEFDRETVEKALLHFVRHDEKGYPPTAGQIYHQIRDVQTSQEELPASAWAKVTKALKNGYYGSKEEFDKLPPLVQQAVGSPLQLKEWSQLETSQVQTVVFSHFLRAYTAAFNRRATANAALPEGESRLRLE